MEITSPLLFASGQVDGQASTAVQNIALDFSVRAPFGVMLNRIALYASLNQLATSAGMSVDVIVRKDSDDVVNADFLPGVGVLDAVDRVNLNSDVLALASITFHSITSPGVSGQPNNYTVPIHVVDWLRAEPSSRPVSVRPMRFAAKLDVETGIAAQTWQAGFLITYQTVKLTDSELVGQVASR